MRFPFPAALGPEGGWCCIGIGIGIGIGMGIVAGLLYDWHDLARCQWWMVDVSDLL